MSGVPILQSGKFQVGHELHGSALTLQLLHERFIHGQSPHGWDSLPMVRLSGHQCSQNSRQHQLGRIWMHSATRDRNTGRTTCWSSRSPKRGRLWLRSSWSAVYGSCQSVRCEDYHRSRHFDQAPRVCQIIRRNTHLSSFSKASGERRDGLEY
jgi:hypothetical protein